MPPAELPDYGVLVFESRHAPGFRMDPVRHPFLEVLYVVGGAGAVTVGRRADDCGPGDVVLVPLGVPHVLTDRPAAPLALYALRVAPAVAGVEPDLARLSPGRQPPAPLATGELRAAVRQMLYEQTAGRPGYRAAVVGLALRFLGLLARGALDRTSARPPADPGADSLAAVQRYVDDLRQRFFEPADLDSAAAGLGLSRRRFTQLFRQAAGTSWLDYLTGLRVAYAAELLRDDRRSVTAAAFESGFEDLSSFYRAFKRRMGQPPSEWRRAAD